MLGLLQLLALGLVLAIAGASLATAHRLRHPPRRTYAFAVARNLPGDPSELDAPRDFVATDLPGAPIHGRPTPRFGAWLIPGDEPAGPVAICTPGWGDSRLGVLPRLDALTSRCSLVVAWDPPGQGESRGPSDLGVASPLHLRAIARSIREEHPEPPIVLHGWSLGAGVSIAAAAGVLPRGPDDVPIAGVVAEAPYRLPWVPAYNVMRQAGLPWRTNGPIAYALLGLRLTGSPTWRGRPPFDRAVHAADLPCPLLLIHGDADDITPIADSESIAAAAPRATLRPIPGANHNDVWTTPEHADAAADALGEFLASVR
jgi:pimeloyl-ACP methyl ester carboxylesterase